MNCDFFFSYYLLKTCISVKKFFVTHTRFKTTLKPHLMCQNLAGRSSGGSPVWELAMRKWRLFTHALHSGKLSTEDALSQLETLQRGVWLKHRGRRTWCKCASFGNCYYFSFVFRQKKSQEHMLQMFQPRRWSTCCGSETSLCENDTAEGLDLELKAYFKAPGREGGSFYCLSVKKKGWIIIEEKISTAVLKCCG